MCDQVPSLPHTSTPTSVDRAHPSTIERTGIECRNDDDRLIIRIRIERTGIKFHNDDDKLIIRIKGSSSAWPPRPPLSRSSWLWSIVNRVQYHHYQECQLWWWWWWYRAVSVPPPRFYRTTVLPSPEGHYSDFDCKVLIFDISIFSYFIFACNNNNNNKSSCNNNSNAITITIAIAITCIFCSPTSLTCTVVALMTIYIIKLFNVILTITFDIDLDFEVDVAGDRLSEPSWQRLHHT